jgi:phosphoenolpyruvate synthase/pyruvate phosphate dikinase
VTNATAEYVVALADCEPSVEARVGGKAAGLGRLCAQQMPVPDGFAVTTDAYRDHVETHSLLERVSELIAGASGPDGLARASKEIERVFLRTPLADELRDAVCAAYRRLGDDAPVAVRSSATAEDTIDASFAGQQETYLWIRGGEAVLEHLRRCWASLFTPQAISYRADHQIAEDDLAMGVVVQHMVPASVSGVMLTVDPVTGDPSQITIEASFGLGLAVVSGEVTPDRYAVDKVAMSVRDRVAHDKHHAYGWDEAANQVRLTAVPADQREVLCLSDEEVLAIAGLGKRLERALGAPQDVEWALGPGAAGERELFLLQTRPETVWARRRGRQVAAPGTTLMERMLKTMQTPIRLKD